MSTRKKNNRVGNNQNNLKNKLSKRTDFNDDECPECGVKLKSKNLATHQKKIHQKEFDMELKEVHKKPGKIGPENIGSRIKGTILRWHPINIIFVIIISSLVLFGAYYLYFDFYGDKDSPGSISGDDSIDITPDDETPVDQNYDWLKSYSPIYEIGSGDGDWWINYPAQHPESSASIEHPQWVLDEISERPVIMLVHSQCEGCAQQTREVPEIVEQYADRIKFFDIDIYDNSENYDISTEIFDTYDPNEEAATIPITVLVSTIKDEDGNDVIIWHSAEGNTGKNWIESYVRDSIYYYP